MRQILSLLCGCMTLLIANHAHGGLTSLRFSGVNSYNQKVSTGFIVFDQSVLPSSYGLMNGQNFWTTTFTTPGGQFDLDSDGPTLPYASYNGSVTTYQNWPVFDPETDNTDIIARAGNTFRLYVRRHRYASATNQMPLSTYSLTDVFRVDGLLGGSIPYQIDNPAIESMSYEPAGPAGMSTTEPPALPYREDGLEQKTREKWINFRESLRMATQVVFAPNSGRRSEEQQRHFVDIRDTFKRLALHPGVSKTLDGNKPQLHMGFVLPDAMAKIIQVNKEILLTHGIGANLLGNPAVEDVDKSLHVKGMAIDLPIDQIRQHLTDDQIQFLAESNGFRWKRVSDPVHFEYDGALTNDGFKSGQLEGWDQSGDGIVKVVLNPHDSDDYLAECTTGSPIELSDSFDVPLMRSKIIFQSAFVSGAGQLSVFLDGDLIGQLVAETPESALIDFAFDVPEDKLGQTAVLRFHFDGPTGSKLHLDNIDLLSITESGDFDQNGVVDGADLAVWQNGYSDIGNVGVEGGDANGDYVVDGTDFLIWQRQLETDTATSKAPEPPALALLATVLLTCGRRVRRPMGQRY